MLLALVIIFPAGIVATLAFRLARMERAGQGAISSTEFIGIAESSQFIVPLGATALAQRVSPDATVFAAGEPDRGHSGRQSVHPVA